MEFHKAWVDQCRSAREIAEAFGTEKALGYLIGEKLLNFVRAADKRPEFAQELLNFVAEIKRILEPPEIQVYLDNVRRVGAEGHACTDEQYEVLRDAGALDQDIVRGAEEVIIVGADPGDAGGLTSRCGSLRYSALRGLRAGDVSRRLPRFLQDSGGLQGTPGEWDRATCDD